MSTSFVPIAESDPVEKIIEALAKELNELFHIEDISSQSRGHRISFEGKLLIDSETGYEVIRQRFGHLGYTPLLKRDRDNDVVVAMEGILEESKTGRPVINILLLAVTIITTLSAGA